MQLMFSGESISPTTTFQENNNDAEILPDN